MRLGSGRGGPHSAICTEDGVGIVANGLRDDRRVLRLIPKLLVTQLTQVGAVVQDLVNEPFAVLAGPGFGRFGRSPPSPLVCKVYNLLYYKYVGVIQP